MYEINIHYSALKKLIYQKYKLFNVIKSPAKFAIESVSTQNWKTACYIMAVQTKLILLGNDERSLIIIIIHIFKEYFFILLFTTYHTVFGVTYLSKKNFIPILIYMQEGKHSNGICFT